jgi:hypothetical protein
MNVADEKSGVELIAEERARQVAVEGWSALHDDGHCFGELSRAAACYAANASLIWPDQSGAVFSRVMQRVHRFIRLCWPFEQRWWKPRSAVRDLVRAGALIAAEIDRLQRVQPKK